MADLNADNVPQPPQVAPLPFDLSLVAPEVPDGGASSSMTRKRAKATSSQKAIANENTTKMWAALRHEQAELRHLINSLAETHNR